VLAAIGIAVGIFLTVSSVTTIVDRIDELQKTPAPGAGVVTLSTGRRAVYYEPEGGTAAVSRPTDGAFLAAVDVLDANGEALPESPTGTSIDISVPGLDGFQMMDVDVPADGRYRLVAADDGSLSPGRLAIGEKVFGDTARTLVLAIAGVVLALLAFTFGILRFLFERKARKRTDNGQFSSPAADGLPPSPSEF